MKIIIIKRHTRTTTLSERSQNKIGNCRKRQIDIPNTLIYIYMTGHFSALVQALSITSGAGTAYPSGAPEFTPGF